MSAPLPHGLGWFQGYSAKEDSDTPWWTLLASFVAVAMAVTHVWQVKEFFLPAGQLRNLHVGFAVLLAFLSSIERTPRQAIWTRRFLIFLVVVSLAPFVYVHLEYKALIADRWFGGNQADLVVSMLLLALALYAAAREWGWIVPILAILALLYGYYGYLFPGDLFFHAGMPFPRLMSTTSFPAFRGLFGTLTAVSAGTIFLFMVFAGVLKATGGLEFIIRIAYAIGGRSRAGPAQVAVVSSGLMGTISGSTVANVASTGAFTIPTMKRFGFKPEFAGAVEAVASTGGQIMPPVMGLAAFMIVGITGTPYVEVMVAGVYPAMIYFLYLMVAVQLRAMKEGLDARGANFDIGANDAEEMTLGQAFRRWGHVLFGVAILIYFLVIRMPPGTAALYAIVALLVMEAVKQLWIHHRTPLAGLRAFVRIAFNGLDSGGRSGAQVAIIIVVINILVEVLVVTGFAQKLSHMMLGIAGSNLIALLLMAAATCLAFGLGLPTSAAYILVALLGAPALVELGVPLLAAHMFVFMLANVSAITPPVAVASMVAANMAKGRFFETSFIAVRLGLPGFLLPFLFIAHPEILGLGAGFFVQFAVSLIALLAVIALNISLEGYFFGPLGKVERVLLLPAAFGMLYPGWMTTAVGMTLLAGIAVKSFTDVRRIARTPPVSAAEGDPGERHA
jgi:TRAP transporter 4TM/12TM fusion protein